MKNSKESHKYPSGRVIIYINLPYVEVISENLRRILKSHKTRSTFYTESTLRKFFCKPKD